MLNFPIYDKGNYRTFVSNTDSWGGGLPFYFKIQSNINVHVKLLKSI